jgi:hypothetical protein
MPLKKIQSEPEPNTDNQNGNLLGVPFYQPIKMEVDDAYVSKNNKLWKEQFLKSHPVKLSASARIRSWKLKQPTITNKELLVPARHQWKRPESK